MKKIIAFTVLTCIFYGNTTLCMLKHISRSKKFCTRSYFTIPRLPKNNLFNTKTNGLPRGKVVELAEDLFNRNKEFKSLSSQQEDIVEQQNDLLLTWTTGHADKLDIESLGNLESELRQTFPRFGSGHANE